MVLPFPLLIILTLADAHLHGSEDCSTPDGRRLRDGRLGGQLRIDDVSNLLEGTEQNPPLPMPSHLFHSFACMLNRFKRVQADFSDAQGVQRMPQGGLRIASSGARCTASFIVPLQWQGQARGQYRGGGQVRGSWGRSI